VNTELPIISVGDEPPPMRPPAPEPNRTSREATKRATRKGKTAGRFEHINAFADFALADLSRAQIAVWILLWRDTKPDGSARTSQADLARRAGVDVSTVKRALQRLRAIGLLSLVQAGGLRRGSSQYHLNPIPRPPPTGLP
jgi:hypothetical protein